MQIMSTLGSLDPQVIVVTIISIIIVVIVIIVIIIVIILLLILLLLLLSSSRAADSVDWKWEGKGTRKCGRMMWHTVRSIR